MRLRIWELAAQEPRFVALYPYDAEFEGRLYYNYSSPTPPPAILHVCRESRACGTRAAFYRAAFLDGPTYVWVNFDVDVIEVDAVLGNLELPESDSLKHIRALFKPDQFSRHAYAEAFFGYSILSMNSFPSLQTFDLVVDDDLFEWTRFTRNTDFGVWGLRDAVRIIKFDTGEYITDKTSIWYEDWSLATRGLPARELDIEEHLDFFAAYNSFPVVKRDKKKIEPYTSDVCPSEFLTPWVRPDLNVLKLRRSRIIENVDESEDVEDSEDAEYTEYVEDSDDSEGVEGVEDSEDVADIEDTQI